MGMRERVQSRESPALRFHDLRSDRSSDRACLRALRRRDSLRQCLSERVFLNCEICETFWREFEFEFVLLEVGALQRQMIRYAK